MPLGRIRLKVPGLGLGIGKVDNRQQKAVAKKAAPKKPGRASRVIEDSEDDDEVQEVK